MEEEGERAVGVSKRCGGEEGGGDIRGQYSGV
jgi:hypothetical protein